MADKSDKGAKKTDNGKKNQTDVRTSLPDSSTFSYEVPIPGASPETIKMSAGTSATSGTGPAGRSWGHEHVQQSIIQLEQILREIVFEFIRECHYQGMDYEANLFQRLSMIDPNISSWVKLPAKNISMMESIPLLAEDMIARIQSSNWMGMDDRQELLKNVMVQIKGLSMPCMEMLIQESQKLDSIEFVKAKHSKLLRLSDFIQKIRGLMQQWIDISVPGFIGGLQGTSVIPHPQVDLLDSQTHLIARVAIPGLKNEQVFVSIMNQGNQLEISGESPLLVEKPFQNEIPFGKFKRLIKLPFKVEEKSYDASVNLGILTIKMKKAGCTKVDIGV